MYLIGSSQMNITFFTFIVFSNNPSAFFYIVWIHRMEAKQYGLKNLVIT
jgi:hypothetical protein